MNKQLNHICTEIGLASYGKKKLESGKIFTIEDLLEAESNLNQGDCCGLAQKKIENILVFIKWLKNHPSADVMTDFDEEVFDEAGKQQEGRKNEIEQYIKNVLGSPNADNNDIPSTEVERDRLMSIDMDKHIEEVVKECERRITRSTYLMDRCGKFAYKDFLDKSIRHFHHLIKSPGEVFAGKKFVVAGRTQSGKTCTKALAQSMCRLLKVPLIVLTKGVYESADLCKKLKKFAEEERRNYRHHTVAATSKYDHCGRNEKLRLIDDAMTDGGTLVIADSASQVKKACVAIENYRRKVPGGKFILAIDEADAMFRTPSRSQVFEQALIALRKLGPTISMFVSATPVPIMLDLIKKADIEDSDRKTEGSTGIEDSQSKEDNIEFFCLEPGDEYVGLGDIKPISMDGRNVYLEQNELNVNSFYEDIPYSNGKVIELYEDALSDPINSKGILVIDCSCPRVAAANNVFEKASAVQKYFENLQKKIIVITITGKGIGVKFPKMKMDKETWKKSLIGDVLQEIDDNQEYGLKVPVFIFGFSKVCRGTSFRSNKRVPTHMLMALGRGHNTSTVIQTFGRATCNGRSILKENGIQHVKILTTRSDYRIGGYIQNYIDEVGQREKSGESYADAVTGSNKKLPHSANFLDQSFREIGRERGLRRQYGKEINFEDSPRELSADDIELKAELWDQKDKQALLRSLYRLKKSHPDFNLDDIADDMNDANDDSLNKKTVRTLLKKFSDLGIIKKVDPRKGWYSARDHLDLFMNKKYGDVPTEPPIFGGSENDSSDLESIAGYESDDEVIRNVTDMDDSEHIVLVNSLAALQHEGEEIHVVSQDSPATKYISYDQARSNAARNGRFILTDPSEKLDDETELTALCNDSGPIRVTILPSIILGSQDKGSLQQELIQEVIGRDDSSSTSSDQVQAKIKTPINTTKSRKRKVEPLSLTNISDIPEQGKYDKTRTQTCITQVDKRRRIYYAAENETPQQIAKRFKVDVNQIIVDNKRRIEYKSLFKTAKLFANSPIVLPLG
mmetsp:Transcript_14299/g.20824  ORF Transcript_14299/g.20824 Transcript_14299/m.20824 type:complete len:1022 (-) Transcript_14299:81-3146(-)|eukprot:CAMPEP_0194079622 /NCGR_PEP_ID=MMETSP0149-20130528/5794_1 /TAXON_ID=122233 /ORGANISM="Chaetoceros debilis, Strain MM31A-1" /LENGTH=1021 /DNA_ID=CAMNT_0038761165 /DNA_START=88 /DNA_END=3153 /DNA_ORIENTATION=+